MEKLSKVGLLKEVEKLCIKKKTSKNKPALRMWREWKKNSFGCIGGGKSSTMYGEYCRKTRLWKYRFYPSLKRSCKSCTLRVRKAQPAHWAHSRASWESKLSKKKGKNKKRTIRRTTVRKAPKIYMKKDKGRWRRTAWGEGENRGDPAWLLRFIDSHRVGRDPQGHLVQLISPSHPMPELCSVKWCKVLSNWCSS